MALIDRVDLEANEVILNRREAEAVIEEHFHDTVATLDDLTSYGSHLVLRCWQASNTHRGSS